MTIHNEQARISRSDSIRRTDRVGGTGRKAEWIPKNKVQAFHTLLNRIIAHEGGVEKAIRALKISHNVPAALRRGQRISARHGKIILDYYNTHVKRAAA